MKYKVGDRVRVQSLDWYNKNKNKSGNVPMGQFSFNFCNKHLCGTILTIRRVLGDYYLVKENDAYWTDEMIEGLVEEDEIEFTEEDKYWCDIMSESDPTTYVLPEGYIFKDENGNVINATKIVLEKVNTLKIQSDNMETETHKGYCTTEENTTNESKKVAWFTFGDNGFADKVELNLSNRELIQENGKWFVVKKKKEYPKTYCKCKDILGLRDIDDTELGYYKTDLIDKLQMLLICRDAYWKIAGEEMGLGKPWSPNDADYVTGRYCIFVHRGNIICSTPAEDCLLTFPTEEMRDAFYENFKELINECKELL